MEGSGKGKRDKQNGKKKEGSHEVWAGAEKRKTINKSEEEREKGKSPKKFD